MNPERIHLKIMYTIDLSEAIIPFSLLQIINQLKCMKTGDILEILGVDEDIIPDLTTVLPAFSFELIGTEAMSADSSNFRLRFKKIENLNTDKPKERCHDSNRSEPY
jgi:TusA-related sulfurtransferase